ncbi:hypothetical protein TNCV_2573141 [Trichonephila clavipes]|nr:hypothetical protein TNCV_2573141 [Trichonephila clavipes]
MLRRNYIFTNMPSLGFRNPGPTAPHLHAEIVEVEIEVVSPSIVPSGNFAELNGTVTCMVLKANDRRTSCPCHDEFRGPRSDYVRQKGQSGLIRGPLDLQTNALPLSYASRVSEPLLCVP